MKFLKLFTSAFLFITLFSVFAATAYSSDFSVFIGIELPGSVEHNDEKISLDNGPVYGFRFGNDLLRNLGLEHMLAFSPDFLYPDRADYEYVETKGFLYGSNLVLNFQDLDSRFVPFLTAGIGLIHQYGDRDLPVGTKFAFNYGGGVKFPNLAGPLGARIDLRGYRAGMSKSINMAELSFGLMLSFGR